MDAQLNEFTLEQSGLPSLESFKDMIDAGVFYGRRKTKTNPRMKHYIFSNRGGIEIIDLQQTKDDLQKAAAFLKEKARARALVLLVGTQPAAHGIVEAAKEFGFPYVANRWIGGTLTNFKTISERVNYFKKLKSDLASGALDKYTKKERLNIEREIKRLEELIGGLENLSRSPDLMIVIDPVLHETAIRETRKLRIPVVAFVNTDGDPESIEYPVVGNNAARKSIDWFLENMKTAVREGQSDALVPPADAEATKSDGTKGKV